MTAPDIAEARRIASRLTEGHCSLLADLFPAAEQLSALADEVEKLRRGECICTRCGLRQPGEAAGPVPF